MPQLIGSGQVIVQYPTANHNTTVDIWRM